MPARFSDCRLDPAQPVPGWATAGSWWNISRSESELSVVCEEALVPSGVLRTGPWRALVVAGSLSHDLVGVLAAISVTLAMAEIPIFAISTFDTDWLLVPAPHLDRASSALRAAGHIVEPEVTYPPSRLRPRRTATRRRPGRWGRAG